MAIVKPLIKMMIENDRNYHGHLLTFGEQEVLIEKNLLENYLGKKFEINSVINSKKIFQSLGFEKIDTLEFIGNKSANIEHDLNLPIPKKHHSRYEFILDSGHMEHCFNVPEIMKSIFYLLKENGTIIHLYPFLCINFE